MLKTKKEKEKYKNQNETKNERVNGIPGAFLSRRETQFESGTATRLGMKGESGPGANKTTNAKTLDKK